MHILTISIDGRTEAHMLAALRETLRRLEAGERHAAYEAPELSYYFTHKLPAQPRGESSETPA